MNPEKEKEMFSFSGIGTKWEIVVDGGVVAEDARVAVLDYVKDFENRFSRFLSDSEVNAFRESQAGEYQISVEFALLLGRADELRRLTHGVYDPAAAGLLEKAGYDANYSMKPAHDALDFILPKWSLDGRTLTLEGPIAFDLGGIGKGYCIDRVADILKKFGYKNFLVDGGGDMFGTEKIDGAPWKVAIEYPGKPDTAAGLTYIKNQGLAVSDSFRRRWGKWHHLVNPKLKKAVETVVGAAAVTPSAWDADCMTSALFFSESDRYPIIAEFFKGSYMVFQNDGRALVSSNWSGEVF